MLLCNNYSMSEVPYSGPLSNLETNCKKQIKFSLLILDILKSAFNLVFHLLSYILHHNNTDNFITILLEFFEFVICFFWVT